MLKENRDWGLGLRAKKLMKQGLEQVESKNLASLISSPSL